MATSSFYEMMEIDTPEKARRLVEAFEAADRRGPLTLGDDSDIFEQLERGREFLKNNPDWLEKSLEDLKSGL